MTTKKFITILFVLSGILVYGEYVLALEYPTLVEHILDVTGNTVMYLCIMFVIISVWLKTRKSLCLGIGSVVLLVEYGMSIFFNINLNQLASMLWCDTGLIFIFIGLLMELYSPIIRLGNKLYKTLSNCINEFLSK